MYIDNTSIHYTASQRRIKQSFVLIPKSFLIIINADAAAMGASDDVVFIRSEWSNSNNSNLNNRNLYLAGWLAGLFELNRNFI